MSTPSVESATERAVKRHRKDVGRLPRRSGLAPHKRTKATLYTVSMLLETYRDPRAVLMEIASMDTEALAKLCQCSMVDALAERRLCAQAVLPYTAQKLPVQIDLKSSRTINLNLVDERQYEELQAVAAEPQADDGSFSMQLIPTAQHTEAQRPEQSGETPATQSVVTEPNDRALAWDISPGNKGAQRKNVTSIEPVTPPAPTDSRVEWLPPIEEWWRKIDGSQRTQPMPDTQPADEPDRWRKTDSGTFGPGRPK